MARYLIFAVLFFAVVVCFAPDTQGQTTEFTYQGSLKDGANPANGNYDFEFLLFDSLTAGTQQGATLTRSNVAVANGTFAVKLDFGSEFPGANRFLEMHVRTAAGGAFSVLSPRQSVGSSPYSVKSLNAETATNAIQLGGVAADQYVVTTDPRMTDARNPLSGSGNYVQNQLAAPQAATNFNISGAGKAGSFTADLVSSNTQYNIAGNPVLSIPNFSLYAGRYAGGSNTTGSNNTFVGDVAGGSNTTGSRNSFFGRVAGNANATNNDNSLFGYQAGQNSTADGNSFFGSGSGSGTTTGGGNSFFGLKAGNLNVIGSNNAFFGTLTGMNNTTGLENTFVGYNAGRSNTTENGNTFIGSLSNGATGITNATAIGDKAVVTQSNSFVLGSINLVNGATADTKVGIGLSAPLFTFDVLDRSGGGLRVRSGNGTVAEFGQFGDFVIDSGLYGGRLMVKESGNVGLGSQNPLSRLDVRGDLFVGLTSAPNGGLLGGNSIFYANDSGNALNTFRIDGFADTLSIVGNSSPGASVGTRITFRTANAGGGEADRVGVNSDGTMFLNNLASGGTATLCRNASNQVAFCSSSLRYKTNIAGFAQGMTFVNKLRPISFDWKEGGMKDVGFGAEDIAKIDPRFVTYNEKGEVEGVKYDRLSVAFVNAFKEQQAQIEAQRELIAGQNEVNKRLQAEIDALKKLVCSKRKRTAACR